MAITKSAKKALRQSKRRKVRNTERARAMRAAIKNVRAESGSAAALAAAYQAIDKALKRGVIKKNTAARKKSRAAKSLASRTA